MCMLVGPTSREGDVTGSQGRVRKGHQAEQWGAANAVDVEKKQSPLLLVALD